MRNEAEETIARLMLEVNRVTEENERLYAKTARYHQLLAELNFLVEYLQNKEPEVYQNFMHYKLGAL